MDILSFVLGIGCVVVAGMLAGTVYLLLSVREMKIRMNNYDGSHASDMSDIFRRVDEQASRLDSRFDKCMHKINALEVNYRGRAFDKTPPINTQDWYETVPHTWPITKKWEFNPGPTCSTGDNEKAK
jgi:hypothetical protein